MTASKKFSDEYLEYLTTLIAQLDRSAISQFADLLLQSRENKTTTFFLGNGGSASTATHFVNDVSLGSRQFKKPFRAISLCDNQAVITASSFFPRPGFWSMKLRQALAALAMFLAARRRTPSGFPSPPDFWREDRFVPVVDIVANRLAYEVVGNGVAG